MPEKVDLSYIINLPPEKAVEYLRSKGYEISFSWREVWQEAHNRAFTVAKAMSVDLLQDIRGEVQKAIDKGTTFDEFRRNLEPMLKKKGWWGKSYMFDNEGNLQPVQLGSVERLETIYDTNLTVAYSVGRYKEQIENVEHRPYWQYLAVMDKNTRPAHAALNGKVFRYDNPFWDKFYPPNDWGCRCHVRALTADDVENEGLTVEKNPPEAFDPEDFAPSEWRYNPGASNLGLDEAMWKKIREVEMDALRRQAVEAMVNAPNRREMFSGFIDNSILSGGRGQSQVAGWMDMDVISYLEGLDRKVKSPIVTLKDEDVRKLLEADEAITNEDLKSIPDAVRDPVAVLWDKKSNCLLYVLKRTGGKEVTVITVSHKTQDGLPNPVTIAAVMSMSELKKKGFTLVKGAL